MDQDPFSVWATPDPLPAPTTASTEPGSASDAGEHPSGGSASHDKHSDLSFGHVAPDDDPGWGSRSATNSPEATRKADPPNHAGADISEAIPPLGFGDAAEDGTALADTHEAEHQPQHPAEQEPATPADDAVADGAQLAPTHTPEEEPTAPAATDPGFAEADAPSSQDASAEPIEAKEADTAGDGFDDFDDFDEPAQQGGAAAADDDFGDFGDFGDGEGQEADFVGAQDGFDDDFDEQQQQQERVQPAAVAAAAPVPTRTWSALAVSRDSSRDELFAPVQQLLPTSAAAAQQMSSDGLRQVEGLAQVLVSEPSRQLWKDLSALPLIKPMDWVRSRTRRDYLIAMGVPVNLDEIHNFALGSSSSSGGSGGSMLPPLKLKLDSNVPRAVGPSSAPTDVGLKRSSSAQASPTPSSLGAGNSAAAAQQRSASASGSPRNGAQSPALGYGGNNRERLAERRREELGLGPPPDVDLKRAEELVAKTQGELRMVVV
ncbi:hypothetical protein ACQY0O_006606 [Thecaphora frezii]